MAMSQMKMRCRNDYGLMQMLEVPGGFRNRPENWEAGEIPALPPQR